MDLPERWSFFAGKDEQGRTIRQEADGSPHIHKSKAPSQQQQQHQIQQQQGSTTVVTEPTPLKIINAKLDMMKLLVSIDSKMDRLLNLAELRK
jgi:hypothetical protein